MAVASRIAAADLVSAFFWTVSETGIAYGQLDPDATEVGDTTSHALAFIGNVISATLPETTYKRATFAGSRQLGTMYMGSNPLGEFEIQLAVADHNLEKMLTGGNIDTTTIANATITSRNSNNTSPNRIGCMFSVRTQDQDEGSDGDEEYKTYVFPICQGYMVETGGNVSDGENPQPVTVNLTPTMASKHPWGTAFSTNEGFAGNRVDHYKIHAEKPYGLTTWIADGAAVVYSTEFLGASSVVTSGNTDNVFAIDGTVTAPTTYVNTTRVVTIAAAGTTGDNHTAFYQLETPIATS